jgi:hypothetical protein
MKQFQWFFLMTGIFMILGNTSTNEVAAMTNYFMASGFGFTGIVLLFVEGRK